MKRPALSLCLVATLLAAQAAAPEVEITAEPHHHLTFENKSVRVFNVEVLPNDATLMHWHRHDYIYVTLGDTEIANRVKDKPPVTVNLKDGQTAFTPATFAHLVRDPSDQPFRNVTIEILEDESLRKSTPHWDEDRGLDILANGTKQILFVKDGIRVTEFELQPGGTAPMPATAYLLVAVSDLRLNAANRPRNAPRFAWDQPLDRRSGDSIWIPAGVLYARTNVGKQPAKFVTLEFP
jgi:hypothetical protein